MHVFEIMLLFTIHSACGLSHEQLSITRWRHCQLNVLAAWVVVNPIEFHDSKVVSSPELIHPSCNVSITLHYWDVENKMPSSGRDGTYRWPVDYSSWVTFCVYWRVTWHYSMTSSIDRSSARCNVSRYTNYTVCMSFDQIRPSNHVLTIHRWFAGPTTIRCGLVCQCGLVKRPKWKIQYS